MLGLAEQIHRHPVRRGGAIGQHQDFTGAGNHVDAHGAKDAALGCCHIGVARAGDLVHSRDGGGAIGQCRHSLRATDGEGACHARHIGGGQHQLVALTLA